MLTKEEIEEFKRITLEVKGLKLTDEQVLDQGLRLVVLYDLLLKVERMNVERTVALHKMEEQNKSRNEQ